MPAARPAVQSLRGSKIREVANAGFGAPRGWLESSPELWREMVLTNVYGAAITIRAALPELQKSEGDVLLTSSVAGRRVLLHLLS